MQSDLAAFRRSDDTAVSLPLDADCDHVIYGQVAQQGDKRTGGLVVAIGMAVIVSRAGCPGNDAPVDLHSDSRVGAGITACKSTVEGEQIAAGLLDDDVFLGISLVGVSGVVDDVQAETVPDKGERVFVGCVQVFTRGCLGEGIAEKSVIPQFFDENRGGPVCLNRDIASLGQSLGGDCQHLSRLGPDDP